MAKRITGTSVNWTHILEALKGDAHVGAFKAKSDLLLRKLAAHPAEPPKIDWDMYKSKISAAGLVDSFKASYEGLKVPYPGDQGLLAKVDKQEVDFRKYHQEEAQQLDAEIEKSKKALDVLNAELPYSEMNMEELFVARPDMAIDHDNPKLWPHFVATPFEKEPHVPLDGLEEDDH